MSVDRNNQPNNHDGFCIRPLINRAETHYIILALRTEFSSQDILTQRISEKSHRRLKCIEKKETSQTAQLGQRIILP